MDWYEETFRLTVVLLVASALVIGAGFAGFGGSLPLVGGTLLLAGALYAIRERLRTALHVAGHDLGHYSDALWLSALVAAVVTLVGLSTTPGELRALGGIVGLLGMANYFLRPVYRMLIALARAFLGTTA